MARQQEGRSLSFYLANHSHRVQQVWRADSWTRFMSLIWWSWLFQSTSSSTEESLIRCWFGLLCCVSVSEQWVKRPMQRVGLMGERERGNWVGSRRPGKNSAAKSFFPVSSAAALFLIRSKRIGTNAAFLIPFLLFFLLPLFSSALFFSLPPPPLFQHNAVLWKKEEGWSMFSFAAIPPLPSLLSNKELRSQGLGHYFMRRVINETIRAFFSPFSLCSLRTK